MSLCYLYLVRQNWMKVIQHTDMYRKFVAYDKESNSYETQSIKKAYNQQEYFCVLSYEMEAYCQMNKLNKSYETMQDIIQLGYSEGVTFNSCSSINLSTFFMLIQIQSKLSLRKPISITTCCTTLPFCTWETIICLKRIRLCRKFWLRLTFCPTGRPSRLPSVPTIFCCIIIWGLETGFRH